MGLILFAVLILLLAFVTIRIIIWRSELDMPPLKYFFGFKKEIIDYGDFQKSVVFYKIISREINIEPRGRRLEVVEYILRDEATRWSKFYLRVRVVNGEVSLMTVNSWESAAAKSKLRCVLTYCKMPEDPDLFYKERCVQKVIDQIQYRPLDLAKV